MNCFITRNVLIEPFQPLRLPENKLYYYCYIVVVVVVVVVTKNG